MLYSNILAHARRCAPAESCGFVVRTPEGERYFPCVNISAEPEAYFRIAPEDWLQAEMQGGDCGAGPQSSLWSALAERGRPASADKKRTVLVAGLPG